MRFAWGFLLMSMVRDGQNYSSGSILVYLCIILFSLPAQIALVQMHTSAILSGCHGCMLAAGHVTQCAMIMFVVFSTHVCIFAFLHIFRPFDKTSTIQNYVMDHKHWVAVSCKLLSSYAMSCSCSTILAPPMHFLLICFLQKKKTRSEQRG